MTQKKERGSAVVTFLTTDLQGISSSIIESLTSLPIIPSRTLSSRFDFSDLFQLSEKHLLSCCKAILINYGDLYYSLLGNDYL